MSEYDQIEPSVLAGSATWHMLYCYISNYRATGQNKRDFKKLIELVLKHFPCEKCSVHAMKNYKKHNIDDYLQNKDRLFLYVSAILQEGANDNKRVPMADRPDYYDRKRYFFESMTGSCKTCGTH